MPKQIKILYASSFWFGSDDRGMKDAFRQQPNVLLDEIDADHFVSSRGGPLLKLAYRIIRAKQKYEYNKHIFERLKYFKPDVFFVSKGNFIFPETISNIKKMGIFTACFYPDKSPKAYGAAHSEAMALYDIVFSSKSFHPGIWFSEYGYENECIHVSHGYDKNVHLVEEPATDFSYDVVMIASARPVYAKLLSELMNTGVSEQWKIAIGGSRWHQLMPEKPAKWDYIGEQLGLAYTTWLREGSVVIAPVENEYVLNGVNVAADQVTARTFQIPAAYNFFVHSYSEEAEDLFLGKHEIPFFRNARELHDLLKSYISDASGRRHFREAARSLGVPAFSLDERAGQIISNLKSKIGN